MTKGVSCTVPQDPGSNPLAQRECGLAVPRWGDPTPPDPGKTAHFLITGVSGGAESDLGTDSDGAVRPNDHPCP